MRRMNRVPWQSASVMLRESVLHLMQAAPLDVSHQKELKYWSASAFIFAAKVTKNRPLWYVQHFTLVIVRNLRLYYCDFVVAIAPHSWFLLRLLQRRILTAVIKRRFTRCNNICYLLSLTTNSVGSHRNNKARNYWHTNTFCLRNKENQLMLKTEKLRA